MVATRLGVLLCLVGATACASAGAGSGGGSSAPVARWSGSFRPTTMASTAVLAPATPNKGSGAIVVTPVSTSPARAKVELSVNMGSTEGGQHAWAIFTGPCNSAGPMVAGQNEFPPLEISSSGDGRFQGEMSFGLEPAGSYHANVYWSSRAHDLNDVMMCANLSPERSGRR
jgi:hypothetical protein